VVVDDLGYALGVVQFGGTPPAAKPWKGEGPGVFELVEELAAARIKARYGPDLSERELRLRLAALWIDRETMVRAFGWDPEIQGY
jgi:hypothetical protein